MDIKSLYTRESHNNGAEMRVKDMFGNLTDFYIRFAGRDSDAWRIMESKIKRDMLSNILGETSEVKAAAQLLAEVTIDWRGLDVEYSKETATELYVEAPYIRDQADTFFSNRANFMQASKAAL